MYTCHHSHNIIILLHTQSWPTTNTYTCSHVTLIIDESERERERGREGGGGEKESGTHLRSDGVHYVFHGLLDVLFHFLGAANS